ncbi:MAG: hypothetical protein ABII76_18590 [Pseudomonadota bacterium]
MNEKTEREEWVLVPREPTREMRFAVWKDQYLFYGAPDSDAEELALKRLDDEEQRQSDVRSFSAMIAAAPAPNPLDGGYDGPYNEPAPAAWSVDAGSRARWSAHNRLAEAERVAAECGGEVRPLYLHTVPPPPVQGQVTRAMVDAAMSSWFGKDYDGRLLGCSVDVAEGARKDMAAAIAAAALAQAEGHSTPAGVTSEELRRIDPIHPDFAGAVAAVKPEPWPESSRRKGVNAESRIKKLEDALRFYADVSKYPAPLTGGMGELWADCGEVARAALAHLGIPDLSKQEG